MAAMKISTVPDDQFEKIVETRLAGRLPALIAIHNTQRGPALGGVRFHAYNNEEAALIDVKRLAESMTYKAALAGLPIGGGKAVIMGNPHRDKKEAVLRDFAYFVNQLKGNYITAKDLGIEVPDLDVIACHTKYVTGTGLKGSSGDPSPMTALGIYEGMKAASQITFETKSLRGLKVLLQGVGKVGISLIPYLISEGVKLFIHDKNTELAKKLARQYPLRSVSTQELWSTKVDIFCPCALGAVINSQTIAHLRTMGVKLIAGAANNQLTSELEDSFALIELDITYVPDFVINAGGLIQVAHELTGYDEKKVLAQTRAIGQTVKKILNNAKKRQLPPLIVAMKMAREALTWDSD